MLTRKVQWGCNISTNDAAHAISVSAKNEANNGNDLGDDDGSTATSGMVLRMTLLAVAL
jgi:hypothetical protein